MPSVTPLGIPWNRAAICLDHRCPSPPGITPGLKDHLRCLLGNLCRASHRWEFPGIGLPSAWNTATHSSWYNTRNQGLPSPPSLESPGIGRLSARIDVALLVWYNTRPPGFHLPHAFVREPYLYHPVYCVCVCLAKNNITPTGIVLYFFREQFIPPGIVLIFREQLVFLVPLK